MHKTLRLDRRLMVLLCTILCTGMVATAQAQAVTTIILFRDGDAIALYVSNTGYVSLEGLTLEVTNVQGEKTTRLLSNFPAFNGLQFDRLPAPVCFVIENRTRPITLPLECQQIPKNNIFKQDLTPANLFWFDSVANEPLLLTITDGTDAQGRCPADQAQCEIPYIPSQSGTPTAVPPTGAPAVKVIPITGKAVVKKSTPFRSGPGPQYPIIATVSAGTYSVTGRNAEATYYQVDYNGQDAWVTAFAQNVEFTIAVLPSPTPVAVNAPLNAKLIYGQTVTGTLERNQKTAYTFTGLAGELISIVVDARFDSYLELDDKGGFSLTEDDNSGGNNNPQINGFSIPKNGEYRIVLRGYSARDVGNFRLTLLKGKVPLATQAGADNLLQYGQKLTDALTPNGQAIRLFNGTKNDVVTITVQADFDSYIQLQDADGKVLISDDDSGGSSNPLIDLFNLPATGTYKIILRGHSANASGTFTLTLLQGFTPDSQTFISYGQAVQDRLTVNDRKVFVFEGIANDKVSVSVQSDFDAHLALRDEHGALIAEDEDSGGNLQPALLDVRLPSKGTYYLVVTGNGPSEYGPFGLRLSAR